MKAQIINPTPAAKETDDKSIIDAAKCGNLEFLQTIPNHTIRRAKCSVGCTALHWAAGSNQIATVHYLLSPQQLTNTDDNQSEKSVIFPDVDVSIESKLAKGRTALHYACRNGHLNIVKILVETYGANPHTKAKQGVTPFQLSIWQNHLAVCQYLVQACGVVASDDVNDFGCGAIHWLGIIPFNRANINADAEENLNMNVEQNKNCGNDGTHIKNKSIQSEGEGHGLMSLAKWLTSQPNMNVHAKQNQGHTVLHKAAWGGHLALIRFLHEEFGMYDDNTDTAGNYAADLCDMMNTERHAKVALYLRKECSLERLESYKLLGLEGRLDASPEDIRKAYLEKAKVFHPDAQIRCNSDVTSEYNENKNISVNDFDQIRKAYEHLTLGGGISTKQRNPAHSINLLLEMQDISASSSSSSTKARKDVKTTISCDENDLFKARLLAVLLEYGDKGLNLANIPKKWDQVWPSVPLDSFFNGGKRKSGALLQMIKDRAGDVVKIVRMKVRTEAERKSGKGAIVIIPRNISRSDVLKYASEKPII